MALSWREEAVLISDADRAGRKVALEGTLLEVIDALRAIPRDARRNYLVAFPERKVPPYRLERDEFEFVLNASYSADLRRPVPLP